MDPITSAIVGSIVGSVVQGVLAPPPVAPATGIVRTLPTETKKGVMNPPWNGQVQIDGQTYLLSPGVVIRNELNMAIPPMMMQAPAPVRFQTDAMGAVYRIWILSAAEANLAENR
ncbi:MAG: hypothetical protein AB1443_14420 [Pseudomonadota bacterium]